MNMIDDVTVKTFKDELDTIFIRGPFEVNNEMYDFKLIEASGGEDYCTKEQMKEWEIQPRQKIV